MPSDDGSSTSRCAIECVTPILRVRELSASLDYYVKSLGFSVDWHVPANMASVSRGRCAVMLCQGGQGQPGTWIWVGVQDAQALFEEFSATGAILRLAPTNYPWAYEFHVQDLDGHVLRFGSEPHTDQPFSDWIDWSTCE